MKEPFILYKDASLTSLGTAVVLFQNAKERAICCASKAFSKTETRYFATKWDFLVIVHFTRHFRHNFLGQKFTIVMDQWTLQWLHNLKDSDGLAAQWVEKKSLSTTRFGTNQENQLDKAMGCSAFLKLKCR